MCATYMAAYHPAYHPLSVGLHWPAQWHMCQPQWAIHWPILNGPWPTPARIVSKQKLGFRPDKTPFQWHHHACPSTPAILDNVIERDRKVYRNNIFKFCSHKSSPSQ